MVAKVRKRIDKALEKTRKMSVAASDANPHLFPHHISSSSLVVGIRDILEI